MVQAGSTSYKSHKNLVTQCNIFTKTNFTPLEEEMYWEQSIVHSIGTKLLLTCNEFGTDTEIPEHQNTN